MEPKKKDRRRKKNKSLNVVPQVKSHERPITFDKDLEHNPLLPVPERRKVEKTRKVLLHVASSDRNTIINQESHEYTVSITPARTNVKFIELVSVELPFTFYPFRSSNNRVYFVDSASSAYTATITEGSYTIRQFLVELKTALEATATSDTFTISKNDNTKKLTITNDTGNFELTVTNTNNAAWREIGYDTLTDLTGSDSYEAESMYNMSGDQFVYITSDLTDSLEDDVIEHTGEKPIIAKVPVNVNFKETIHYEPFERIKLGFTSLILSRIKFTITDKDFVGLDLHKIDWGISFLLTEIRP